MFSIRFDSIFVAVFSYYYCIYSVCARARVATIAVIQRSHARSSSLSIALFLFADRCPHNQRISQCIARERININRKNRMEAFKYFAGALSATGKIEFQQKQQQHNLLEKNIYINFVYTYSVWYAITSYKIASLIFIRIFLCRRVCILVLLFLHTSAQCAVCASYWAWPMDMHIANIV